MDPRNYIFYITKSERFAFATREYWEEHKHLSSARDPELNETLSTMFFEETMENQFEYQGSGDITAATESLLDYGFVQIER